MKLKHKKGLEFQLLVVYIFIIIMAIVFLFFIGAMIAKSNQGISLIGGLP